MLILFIALVFHENIERDFLNLEFLAFLSLNRNGEEEESIPSDLCAHRGMWLIYFNAEVLLIQKGCENLHPLAAGNVACLNHSWDYSVNYWC